MRIECLRRYIDPVDLGHLILAEQCRSKATDQVRFIPTARPPHKQGRKLTPFRQPVEMLASPSPSAAFHVEEMEETARSTVTRRTQVEEVHRRQPEAEIVCRGSVLCRISPSGTTESGSSACGAPRSGRSGWPLPRLNKSARVLAFQRRRPCGCKPSPCPLMNMSPGPAPAGPLNI